LYAGALSQWIVDTTNSLWQSYRLRFHLLSFGIKNILAVVVARPSSGRINVNGTNKDADGVRVQAECGSHPIKLARIELLFSPYLLFLLKLRGVGKNDANFTVRPCILQA
jgi:hypothetical protein